METKMEIIYAYPYVITLDDEGNIINIANSHDI